MRSVMVCSFAALLSTCPAWSEGLSARERADVVKTHEAATAPVHADPGHADWEKFIDAHYDAKAMILPPNGPPAEGREAILALFKLFPPVSRFHTTDVELEGGGGYAFIRGAYEITVNPPGGDPVTEKGKYIEIWRKRADGSWRCVRDIWNSDAPP